MMRSSSSSYGELAGPCDVLIVDPPRKGLDDAVVQKLVSSGPAGEGEADPPKRIVYVSCGFKAFGRDYARLKGRYRAVHAEGHVLFPGANHIETLCVLDRRDVQGTGRAPDSNGGAIGSASPRKPPQEPKRTMKKKRKKKQKHRSREQPRLHHT